MSDAAVGKVEDGRLQFAPAVIDLPAACAQLVLRTKDGTLRTVLSSGELLELVERAQFRIARRDAVRHLVE